MVLWYASLHSVIMLFAWLSFPSGGWLYSASVGIVGSFYYVSAFYFTKRRVCRLYLDNGQWSVCYADNPQLIPVLLLRGGFFSPLVTVLPFKEKLKNGKTTYVLFVRPLVDKELFRQLRVRVGFGEGVR